MTFYTVMFYCNDEVTTAFQSTQLARNGTPTGAMERVFERMPDMPKDIVGSFVIPEYLH